MNAKIYLRPHQTSMIELFLWKQLKAFIFAKSSIHDVRLGPKYTSRMNVEQVLIDLPPQPISCQFSLLSPLKTSENQRGSKGNIGFQGHLKGTVGKNRLKDTG